MLGTLSHRLFSIRRLRRSVVRARSGERDGRGDTGRLMSGVLSDRSIVRLDLLSVLFNTEDSGREPISRKLVDCRKLSDLFLSNPDRLRRGTVRVLPPFKLSAASTSSMSPELGSLPLATGLTISRVLLSILRLRISSSFKFLLLRLADLVVLLSPCFRGRCCCCRLDSPFASRTVGCDPCKRRRPVRSSSVALSHDVFLVFSSIETLLVLRPLLDRLSDESSCCRFKMNMPCSFTSGWMLR